MADEETTQTQESAPETPAAPEATPATETPPAPPALADQVNQVIEGWFKKYFGAWAGTTRYWSLLQEAKEKLKESLANLF